MASDLDLIKSAEITADPVTLHVENGHPDPLTEEDDSEWQALRDLILGSYKSRITELNSELSDVQNEMDDVQQQLDQLGNQTLDEQKLLETISPHIAESIRTSIQNSRPQMIEAISPIMADTIRTGIRDSRGEMVEALYPIVGQLVQRAVREAMKDLARRIDQQIQSRLSITRQIRALLTGVSPAELVMRESLPFDATDIFLIHRYSGLLLIYVNDKVIELNPDWAIDGASAELPNGSDESHHNNEDRVYDSDLISGMLTAIRDFVQDAFGSGDNEELNQVNYGNKQILIETAEHAYMAVVVEGTQPAEFRATIRDRLIDIENTYIDTLRDYDGNAAPFEATKDVLQSLLLLSDEQRIGTESSDSSANIHEQSNNPEHPNTTEPPIATADQHQSNSTSLNPLSILLLINAVIFFLWWLTQ